MTSGTVAERRLQGVAGHLSNPPTYVVTYLPDRCRVTRTHVPGPVPATRLALDGKSVVEYSTVPGKSYAYDLSSVGTPLENKTEHVPKYPLLQLGKPSDGSVSDDIPLGDFWGVVYALHAIHNDQEYIPISLTTLPSHAHLVRYLLTSGLARVYPNKQRTELEGVYFLSRNAFWQGAGTQGFHTRSWLPSPRPVFPAVASFTRAPNVIAKHPQRPPKPEFGEVLYRRWCSALGQMFEVTYFDIDGVTDSPTPPPPAAAGGQQPRVSKHMAAFHRWHNDQRVNAAWGEQGKLEDHIAYVRGLHADPHAWPCLISWDGELMGYIEINYTKEDHVAPYYPLGTAPGEWDRGLHVLVGESKFLGRERTEIWMRSLIHFVFLADPRTENVIGEPAVKNKPIQRVADDAGFHRVITFDFPYKRSALVLNQRDKFFTSPKIF